MERYDGIANDSIERGGKYNKHSVGHEVCNFSDCAGTLYGYVQPTGSIKLEKLGASKDDAFVDGVTVVWTAGPESGGTVVVGWYKDATVFRDVQKLPKPTQVQKANGVLTYRVKAATADAFLLPVPQRELIIPRAVKGGIGQSNVWFADQPESAALRRRVLALIQAGSDPGLPDVDYTKSVLEGNPRLVAHLRRERNRSLVEAKIKATLRTTGKVCCEACDFDFEKKYGELGSGFGEVHHLRPLAKADREVKTGLDDLAIVCSNCHRIIHRSDPMLGIQELRKLILCRGA